MKIIRLCIGSLLGSFAVCLSAFTQQGQDYLELLDVAQRHVREQRLKSVVSTVPGSPASAVAMLGLSESFYTPGETWTVSFTPRDQPMVRKVHVAGEGGAVERQSSLFDFKVLTVESGTARVEIRQRMTEDARPVDPRVERVVLHVNRQYVVTARETYHRDGRAPKGILQNGKSNISIGFSAYPVDLPALNVESGETVRQTPSELRQLSGFDPSKALEFNLQDLYARPVRAIWRDGDPWPVYVRTPAGTALLRTTSRGVHE